MEATQWFRHRLLVLCAGTNVTSEFGDIATGLTAVKATIKAANLHRIRPPVKFSETQTNPRGAQGHFFCPTIREAVTFVPWSGWWLSPHLDCQGRRRSCDGADPRLYHGNWDRFTWAGNRNWHRHRIYTLQRRIKLLKNPSGIPRGRRVFLEQYGNKLAIGWGALSVGWACGFAPEWEGFIDVAFSNPLVFGGLAILSLGYASNPFTSGRGWREIPRLKWPVIAFAWGLVTGWLPLQFISSVSALDGWTLGASIGAQTLFVAGITLPFDVRDVFIDPAELRTIPQQTGTRFTTALAVSLVLISMGAFYGLDHSLARTAAGAMALIGIALAPTVRKEWVFSLWLDGCLILQGCWLFCSLDAAQEPFPAKFVLRD